MATIDVLQARLERLREVRASGRLRVSYEGTSVEFRTDADLAAAIADLERRIAIAGGRPRVSVIYVNSSKGT